VAFTGVAAGDVSNTEAIVWTRAIDSSLPAAATTLSAQVSTSNTFSSPISLSGATYPAGDFTLKFDFTNLTAGTQYFYRFVGPGGETSNTGKFKTAPASSTAAPLHFAFSGDNDGLMRPYALASTIPAQNLDFYVNLGDTIYENGSNLTLTGAHNGASWLNSPSVTLSNDALNFNGIPRAFIPLGTPFATQAQLRADYAKNTARISSR
jgi:phosphodiesterase/alkaline phosphatase D-like protein